MTLDTRAWLALAIVAVVMCALLFGTAGTTHYWHAWIYVSIFLGASVLTTLYLMKRDRAVHARRMRGGPMFEKEGTQRIIMVFTSLGFIALLVVPALDHRFGWSAVPVWGVVLGDVLVAIGFYFIFLVYRENTGRTRMFDPSWDAGCPSCSFLADNMGHLAHLHARRTTLALVSRGAAQEDRGVQEAHGVDDSLVLVLRQRLQLRLPRHA
jgi:uncharacterized membrane protein YbhN (UPF0104 family)